ncbi:hypothetical protein GCM10009841_32250 [Microlunatus panaciterrae]|uniref:Very-short-patch-repair endonuclease n=1 Tax=Microlunatus panaciterrae TaxID=400768 RepID=A0ABS2RGS7_9ACTN|nr:DUF559 domain-containing protein [Microlunatus panaciterrae]MBM7797883.1 very-short-patch-repair endonuclease [Microlunatus panaciterrae]
MKAEIARVLTLQGGVLARREHPELARQLDWLVRRGELAHILPGVYVLPELRQDALVRIRAAMEWVPEGVLTGRAAAKVSFWEELRVESVTMAVRSGRASRPGFQLSRRTIPAEQVRRRLRLCFTAPALTAVDLAADLGGDAIDRVLRTGFATLEDLQRAMAQSPGRPGNKDRRTLLLDSRDRPWSAAERRTHRLLRAAGITGWQANFWVELPDGGVFLDVAFVRARVALEVDGWEFHGRIKADFERTWRRHNALVAAGWRVLHITWQQLVDEPDWVIARIRDVLDSENPDPNTSGRLG